MRTTHAFVTRVPSPLDPSSSFVRVAILVHRYAEIARAALMTSLIVILSLAI